MLFILKILLIYTSAANAINTFNTNYHSIFKNNQIQLFQYHDEEVFQISPLATSDELKYVLPQSTRPIAYEVLLKTGIDKKDFDFQGEVTIKIEVLSETSSIVMHSLVEIDDIQLMESDGETIVEWDRHEPDEQYQFLTIHTKDKILLTGELYFVNIKYHATLRGNNNDYTGFYRSSYLNSKGEKVWLATTHFVPFHTRHAFPCYDEPSLKASFKITIDHGCSYRAISNMPETMETLPGDNGCRTTFPTTPIMPTYLVAFIISDYKSIHNYDLPLRPNETRHRIFANENYIENTQFGLDTGIQMLNEIAEYFGYPYVMPKLDQIGIPTFAVGAMENWGLVTYVEQTLYPDVHSISQRFNSIRTISHELTHKWFGNLVTPAEFSYLWLKEGFATLFGSFAPHRLYPEMRFMDYFVAEICRNVKVTDSLRETRPMSLEVHARDSIQGIYDTIAYDKSGCVLLMFLHAITEENFKTALNNYLNEHEFSPAEPDDLSNAFETVRHPSIPSNIHFKEILDSWHTQSGFPLVTVNYNRETHEIRLEQSRFLSKPDPENPDESVWWIPFNMIFKYELDDQVRVLDTQAESWLSEKRQFVVPTPERNWSKYDSFVLLNKGQTGYYRVNYDKQNWENIIHFLITASSKNFVKLPVLSRSQLIEDAAELAYAGQLDYEIFLLLLTYLDLNENDAVPWLTAASKIDKLINSFYGTPSHSYIMHYIQSIFGGAYIANLFDDDPILKDEINSKRFTSTITEIVCKAGLNHCLDMKKSALESHLNGEKILNLEEFLSIVNFGVRKLKSSEYYVLWKTYSMLTESDVETKSILREALANTPNLSLLAELLNSILVEGPFTEQNITINYTNDEKYEIIAEIIRSEDGFDIGVEFLDSNFNIFSDQLQASKFLDLIASRIFSQIRFQQCTFLIEKYQKLGVDTSSFTERVESNLQWSKTFGNNITKWLVENNYDRDNQGGGGGVSKIILARFLIIFSVTFALFNF